MPTSKGRGGFYALFPSMRLTGKALQFPRLSPSFRVSRVSPVVVPVVPVVLSVVPVRLVPRFPPVPNAKGVPPALVAHMARAILFRQGVRRYREIRDRNC